MIYFFRVLHFICFFAFGCVFGDENLHEKWERADELLQATLFDEAAILYQDLLDASEKGELNLTFADEQYIRLKLAQTCYGKKDYYTIISLLQGVGESSQISNLNENEFDKNLHQMGLHLLGLAYKNLKQYDKAVQVFNAYLKLGEKKELPFYDLALFELGSAYHSLGQLDSAKKHFENLQQTENRELYVHSRLLLVSIAQAQGNLKEAEKILAALEKDSTVEFPLYDQILYSYGNLLYSLQDYPRAALMFERSLKQGKGEKPWQTEALYQTGWCYLHQAEKGGSPIEENHCMDRAEASFLQLVNEHSDENLHLALGQLYLTKAKKTGSSEAARKAVQILENQILFSSLDAQAQALFLRAELASNLQDREDIYRQLTQDEYKSTPFYSIGWYYRGLNEYQIALNVFKAQKEGEVKKGFFKAALSFEKAFEQLKKKDKKLAELSVLHLAEACLQKPEEETLQYALRVFNRISQDNAGIIKDASEPGQFYYLHGLIAFQLAQFGEKENYIHLAEEILSKGLKEYPQHQAADKMLHLLGLAAYQNKHYPQAEMIFSELANKQFSPETTAEALFWAAKSCDAHELGSQKSKQLRQQIFDQYPQSKYAAEAYFFYYPYKEYLQGDRAAIKHLQGMAEKFSQSPYIVNAYYLMGMDFKRDRKSLEGRWIRKKNMNDAIEALHNAEAAFDTLYEKNEIPLEDLNYFIKVRYHATLERALSNMAIADESQGAKRKIFLEYAAEVLNQIVKDFNTPDHAYLKHLRFLEAYPQFLEEGTFWLAQACIKSEEDDKAAKIFTEMLERYKTAKITRGYFLSRVLYEVGIMAMRHDQYSEALQYFVHSEDAGKGKILNTDQKIDLLIQQSLCYKALKEMDKAMLILSKVINDDAISSLRVKAMYLRAEIYEMQGRQELARKQLEATSKKGGEWAMKAKQKLQTSKSNGN